MAASAVPLIEKLKEQFSGTSYRDYQKSVARRKVVDELSKLILNQPVESDSDSSSNLFKILVKRFKVQLEVGEKDPSICDTAARKLAKFVETIMKEAYFAQRQKRRNSSIRSLTSVPAGKRESSSRVRSVDGRLKRSYSKESGLEKDSIIKGLGFADSKTSSPVVIEKVPRSFARNVPKCGPLYSAKIDGRKVYVQEVREGDTKKALISRVNSESIDPVNKEWSSWMVDLANKTKEWIKWLDEKASLVDNRKPDSASTARPSSSSSAWSAVDDRPTSRVPGLGRGRREHEVANIYQNVWREPSSESLVSDQSPGPSTTSTHTRYNQSRGQDSSAYSRNESRNSRRTRGREINDFHITSNPGSSKYNNYYTFASSKRRPSSPSTI